MTPGRENPAWESRPHGLIMAGWRPRMSRRLGAKGGGACFQARARAAYHTVSRAQLVAYGLRDSWISFEDAIPPNR